MRKSDIKKMNKKSFIFAITFLFMCFFAAQSGYYKVKCNRMDDTLYYMKFKYNYYCYSQTQKMLRDKTVKYNYLDDKEIYIDKNNIYRNVDEKLKVNLFSGVSAQMAARIAESIWFSLYGDTIIEMRPIQVFKEKKRWLVKASRQYGNKGIPYIEIDQKDGTVVGFGYEEPGIWFDQDRI